MRCSLIPLGEGLFCGVGVGVRSVVPGEPRRTGQGEGVGAWPSP